MTDAAPAGWYDDGSGRQRWWDGTGWTEHYADKPAVDPNAPLYTFISHIEGRNAKAFIYRDRIEWERSKAISKKLRGSEMIPVKTITSVATKRDGLINTIVTVITSGNTIDFRVGHAQAAVVRTVLNDLILGKYEEAAKVAVAAPAETAPAATSITAQIQELAALRDSGLLTEDEFTAKKTELLARI